MSKSKRKTEAQKEREAAKPAKPKTLDELLMPGNDYERLVAEHVRGRHDAALEAAIVANQRSVQKCLSYVAGMARQKANGAQCVVMSDEEVYGLAAHFFIDGDTPIETAAGAPVTPASKPEELAPATKTKAKAKKKAKTEAETEKKEEKKRQDDGQLLFGFWDEAKTEAETEKKEEP